MSKISSAYRVQKGNVFTTLLMLRVHGYVEWRQSGVPVMADYCLALKVRLETSSSI